MIMNKLCLLKGLIHCVGILCMMRLVKGECKTNFKEQRRWNGSEYEVFCCQIIKDRCPPGTFLQKCVSDGGKDYCISYHSSSPGSFHPRSLPLSNVQLVITVVAIPVIIFVIFIVTIIIRKKYKKDSRQTEVPLTETKAEMTTENSANQLLSDSGISLTSGGSQFDMDKEPMISYVQETCSKF